jgi:hypothetical protein
MVYRHRFMRIFCMATLVVMVCIGAAWMVANFRKVPQYGDTIEYLQLTRTLHIDQYRTIFYPLILRLTHIFHGSSNSPHTNGVYLFQCLAVYISCFLFTEVVLDTLKKAKLITFKHGRLLATSTSLLVLTNPLVAHFSLTLLTDSLASSFTIATIACVARAADPDQRKIWLPIAAICVILMALSRLEKLYVAFCICIGAAVLMWATRHSGCSKLRTGRPWALALVLGMALLSVPLINRLTQTINPNRPPLDLSSLAFNRAVWPRMSEVYPKLPEDARRLISAEDARNFDINNNNVYPLLSKLLAQNANNKKIINEITITTVRNFPMEVIGKTFFDFSKYEVPNLAFPLELSSALPKSWATDWTHSRMSMFSPKLTDISLAISTIVFLLIQIPLAILTLKHIGSRKLLLEPITVIGFVAITMNSALFSLEAGMDAHIRYALPTYTLLLTVVTLLSMLWLLEPLSAQRKEEPTVD